MFTYYAFYRPKIHYTGRCQTTITDCSWCSAFFPRLPCPHHGKQAQKPIGIHIGISQRIYHPQLILSHAFCEMAVTINPSAIFCQRAMQENVAFILYNLGPHLLCQPRDTSIGIGIPLITAHVTVDCHIYDIVITESGTADNTVGDGLVRNEKRRIWYFKSEVAVGVVDYRTEIHLLLKNVTEVSAPVSRT